MKKFALGLLVGVFLFGGVTAAQATNVTVRVEGQDKTLVPETTVALPALAPKPNGSDPCAANSAGAALWVATAGSWNGSYYAGFGDYLVTSVAGESYLYPDPRSWEIWINGKSALGTCTSPVQEGDQILLIVTRCELDAEYNCTNPPVLPLELTVPKTAAPGVPVNVVVRRINKDGSKVPAAGASITSPAGTVATDGAGSVSIALTQRGLVSLTATLDGAVRDARSICITDGADGYCGTTPAPGVTPPPPSEAGVVETACVTSGRDGLCGSKDTTQPWSHLKTPKHKSSFKRGRGPRTLSGTIEPDGSGIAKVELRLTRRSGKNCQTYSDKSERFIRVKRCGAARGKWFAIGDRQDWRYLLPTRLKKGRYVLDVRVTDKAGNQSHLARTYTRSVFKVA
jgi:hypothetical protein